VYSLTESGLSVSDLGCRARYEKRISLVLLTWKKRRLPSNTNVRRCAWYESFSGSFLVRGAESAGELLGELLVVQPNYEA
jgi:hypothetical protein